MIAYAFIITILFLLLTACIAIIVLSLVLYKKDPEPFIPGVNYSDKPDYTVLELPQFLTYEECDNIIELSKDNLFPSKIYDESSDLLADTKRVSEQAWLDDSDPFIKRLSDKIKNYTNTPNNFQEKLQVVKYSTGGFFKPHYDACEGGSEFCKRMDGENGPRYLTVLIYLNDDYEGGETVFPLINKSIVPRKGKAVIFQNVDKKNGYIITQSVHGGEPVTKGSKWIANKWIRLG